MTRKLLIFSFLLLVPGPWSLVPGPAAAKNLIPSLSRPGLPPWNPPPVEKLELPNGLRLYLLADRALPLFQATFFIETGEAYHSHQKSGLADLLATLLITGGTITQSPQALDQWLETNAIQLSAEAGRELTRVDVSALAHQWQEALGVLKEVCLEPRFDPQRLDLAKSRFQEGLRREKDQPDAVLERAFRQALYGKKHPWGHLPTPQTIRRTKRDDLISFHRQHFHPARMTLTVAGDFSPAQIKAWVRQNFQNLAKKETPDPNWEIQPFQNKPRTQQIKKPVNQVFLEAGHLGLVRHQEERYAYGLLQYILGGDAFTSRLGKDIRTVRGLAYSVYSDWEALPTRGHFSIHVETKAESADEVRAAILQHLTRLHEQADITAEELERSREALLNQYIFWFDSPFERVNMQAKLDLLGYPSDYLEAYPQKIKGVTLEEVKNIAKKYLEPDKLTTVLVQP